MKLTFDLHLLLMFHKSSWLTQRQLYFSVLLLTMTDNSIYTNYIKYLGAWVSVVVKVLRY